MRWHAGSAALTAAWYALTSVVSVLVVNGSAAPVAGGFAGGSGSGGGVSAVVAPNGSRAAQRSLASSPAGSASASVGRLAGMAAARAAAAVVVVVGRGTRVEDWVSWTPTAPPDTTTAATAVATARRMSSPPYPLARFGIHPKRPPNHACSHPSRRPQWPH